MTACARCQTSLPKATTDGLTLCGTCWNGWPKGMGLVEYAAAPLRPKPVTILPGVGNWPDAPS